MSSEEVDIEHFIDVSINDLVEKEKRRSKKNSLKNIFVKKKGDQIQSKESAQCLKVHLEDLKNTSKLIANHQKSDRKSSRRNAISENNEQERQLVMQTLKNVVRDAKADEYIFI